ncbi:MAG: hypothetical protein AAGG01_14800 [Planctomycetota bacterium]
MITIVKLRELFGNLSPRGMEQVFTDWEMLFGFGAKTECEPIAIAGSVEEIKDEIGEQHIVIETQIEKNEIGFGPIYFGFPNSMVMEIIGEVLMIPADVREEKARSGLSKNDIETFQEMANLLCGSWNRVFQDLERNLRISQSVEDLKVSPTVGSKNALVERIPEGRLAWVRSQVVTESATFPALIALPFEVALAIAEEFYATVDPRSAKKAS